MSGSVLTRARADMARFTTAGGFEEDITLSLPDGTNPVAIKGLTAKPHMSLDTDGQVVDSARVHVTVIEAHLVAAGYTVRNASAEVSLHKHRVAVADSTGVVRNYRVSQSFPDETLGSITLILVD